ncbi:DUF397 domain-containing protein [Actinoallomurus iriomotensis]
MRGTLGTDPPDPGGTVTTAYDEWCRSSRSGSNGGECVEVATVVTR